MKRHPVTFMHPVSEFPAAASCIVQCSVKELIEQQDSLGKQIVELEMEREKITAALERVTKDLNQKAEKLTQIASEIDSAAKIQAEQVLTKLPEISALFAKFFEINATDVKVTSANINQLTITVPMMVNAKCISRLQESLGIYEVDIKHDRATGQVSITLKNLIDIAKINDLNQLTQPKYQMRMGVARC